jgi:F-type H+-transporting ATPase subunit gamma
MAQTRGLRQRIKSVHSIRQITKTMEMVATSRLKRAQDRVVAARPYAAALTDVIADLYSADLAERFALLRQPGPGGVKRVALIVITSNRGLAGAFNANLIREARRRLEELEAGGATVALHLVGKKGIGSFRYAGRTAAVQRTDIGDKPTTAHAVELVGALMHEFEIGTLDAVEVVFAKFNSAMSTPATVLRILPVEPPKAGKRAGGQPAEAHSGAPAEPAARRYLPFYILKPSAEALLERLLPLYVQNQMFRALVETAAAEHGARRTAMKNATDNAGDILDILKRTYNRARQAQITQEIAEIVGGAEAQKG